MDRRLFFRNLGYGAAGLTVAPGFISACTLNGGENHDTTVWIGGIMPISLVLDCSHLLSCTSALAEKFSLLIEGDIHKPLTGNLSRLGSSIPFEAGKMIEYMEVLRKEWDPTSETQPKKLSLLLGWLMIHPLKKAMSGVYGKLIAQGYHYDTITLYYDAYMIRQISTNPGSGLPEEKDVQDFLNTLVPRMVTRLHTFKPDYLDGPGWLVRMSEWRENNPRKMNSYGSLIARDDPEMYKQFVNRHNVYNPEDRLLELLRKSGSAADPGKVDKLIMSDPGNSIYTKSLVRGYENVLAAENYFTGKSDITELKKRV